MTPYQEWILAAIVALTPVVVQILDWIVDQFKATMPSWLKPLLATALGAFATYLAGLTVGDPILAALVGLAAIGIREIVVRLGITKALGLRK